MIELFQKTYSYNKHTFELLLISSIRFEFKLSINILHSCILMKENMMYIYIYESIIISGVG